MVKKLLINATQLLEVAYHVNLKEKIKYFIKKYIMLKKITAKDYIFWPNGLLAWAIEKGYTSYENKKYLEILKLYFDRWIFRGNPIRYVDDMLSGYSLIYLSEKLKENKYEVALQNMYLYLKKSKKNSIGSIAYGRERDDILVDGLGMFCPFLCRYSQAYGEPEAKEMAMLQIKNFLQYGMDSVSGLPYHGYNLKNEIKTGIIGWGRAVGWLLFSLIESLDNLSPETKEYIELSCILRQQISNIKQYQRTDGYFSWQLQAKEGEKDTSATAMILYTLQKAVNLGILDYQEERYCIIKGKEALDKSIIGNEVQDCLAECAGLGEYPQIYGAFKWSLGPTIAFFIEWEKHEIKE